jgi:hypothetical protein
MRCHHDLSVEDEKVCGRVLAVGGGCPQDTRFGLGRGFNRIHHPLAKTQGWTR